MRHGRTAVGRPNRQCRNRGGARRGRGGDVHRWIVQAGAECAGRTGVVRVERRHAGEPRALRRKLKGV